MGEWFGTDGIRGVANVPPLTPDFAVRFGRAVSACLGAAGERRVVVGRDTRGSGDMLAAAVAAGCCAAGVEVWDAGVMPTPAVSFLARDLNAAAGIVISASHNPYTDNGLKLVGPDGAKLPEAVESEIESLIRSDAGGAATPAAGRIGRLRALSDAAARYREFCLAPFADNLDLRGCRLVVDCANGAMSALAGPVLRRLGAEPVLIHHQPDGRNINHACGSEHPEALAAAVLAAKADAGLAFDGDGDRLTAVDETGTVLTGDQVLAVCREVVTQYPHWSPAQKRRVLRLVQLRFVEGWTLQAIGDDLFLSRERIRQIEAKVLCLVRRRLAGRDRIEISEGGNDDRIAAQS